MKRGSGCSCCCGRRSSPWWSSRKCSGWASRAFPRTWRSFAQAGLVQDRRVGQEHPLRARGDGEAGAAAADPRGERHAKCRRPRATKAGLRLDAEKAQDKAREYFDQLAGKFGPQLTARGALGRAWRTCSSRWCRRWSSPISARAKARWRSCSPSARSG